MGWLPSVVLWLILLFWAITSPSGYDGRIEWLKVGSYLLAYWAWTELSQRHGRWRWVLGVLMLWGASVSWYALIQHVRGVPMVWWIERPDVYGMRASGTFICPNHFAAFLEIILVVSMAVVLCSESRAPLRVIAGYTLLVVIPALFLTMSRSGWLGAAAGVGVVVLLLGWRKSAKAFWGRLIGLLLLGVTVASLAWFLSPRVRERVRGAHLDTPDPAVQARLQMWRTSLRMIREEPVFGFGLGSYAWVFPRFKDFDTHRLFNYAHNEFLHTAAETGLPMTMLWALVIAYVVGALARNMRRFDRPRDAHLAAALAGAVTAQVIHSNFDFNLRIFSIVHTIVVLAGITMGCLYQSQIIQPLVSGPTLRRWIGWGVTAVVMLLLTGSLQVYISYGLHRLGEKAADRLDLDRAEALFRASARVDPWNWRSWQSLGHTARTRALWNVFPEEKRMWANQALKYYQRALQLHPIDPETLYGMSTAHNLLGDRDQALKRLREAVQLNPTHVFYLNRLGLQLREMGRLEEALAVFKEVAQRWGTSMAHLNVTQLERQLSQTDTPAAPLAEPLQNGPNR